MGHARWEDVKAAKRAKDPRSDAEIAAEAEVDADFELGQLVYDLRTAAGLTQAQLAQRMGTTQTAIARLEGAGGAPRLQTLEKLARALGRGLVVALPGPEGDTAPTDRVELVRRAS